jgi:hypothetical protein
MNCYLEIKHRVRQGIVFCFVWAASTVLVSGQTQSGPPPIPPERAADSYQIYSVLMPGQVFASMDNGKPWAISGITVNADDMNPRLAPDAVLNPPEDHPHAFKEAVADFYQRKGERFRLTQNLQLNRSYVLLSPADGEQLKASKVSPNASSSLRSTYGDYVGITYFSEVYFNTKQTAALVYMLDWCGNLCAQANWVYLEKHNGKWVRRSGKAPAQT